MARSTTKRKVSNAGDPPPAKRNPPRLNRGQKPSKLQQDPPRAVTKRTPRKTGSGVAKAGSKAKGKAAKAVRFEEVHQLDEDEH
ncbi:hypothetical protein K469DRAFT_217564 [Zopfia rhizophila CBS 207.26]|uniref:Uncharacterized protein n=1 Tax=Zopfia rhizophila CBS 207.26 TaxID=1314779 RepID=A0A6A6DV76_9PEZI|nr:hypothetical protein K469DRAFT_217564 [Zopfia rhizophila CBS 207.26]